MSIDYTRIADSSTPRSSPFAQRAIARSQASLRILNARIELQFDAMMLRSPRDQDELLIRCECGRAACDAVIELRRGEVHAARLNRCRFVVVPRHGVAGVEHLVVRTDRFDLVETDGEAAGVAADLALVDAGG